MLTPQSSSVMSREISIPMMANGLIEHLESISTEKTLYEYRMRSNNFRPLVFRVPDASHVEGNKYRTTREMMQDHSRAYKEWVATRKELASALKQASAKGRKQEASEIKAELLAVQMWERPDEEYATVIEPLAGRDESELHLTTGGKGRSKKDQEVMKDYLKGTGRHVPPENSSRTPLQVEEDRKEQVRAELLAKSIQTANDLGEFLKETAPGVKSTYTKPKK